MSEYQGGLPFSNEDMINEEITERGREEFDAIREEFDAPREKSGTVRENTEQGGEDQMNFEEAMEELETIVRHIETETLPLEEAIAQFERGMKLAEVCSGKLDEAQGTIEKLIKKEDEPKEAGTDEMTTTPLVRKDPVLDIKDPVLDIKDPVSPSNESEEI